MSELRFSFGTTATDTVWFSALWEDRTPAWTSPEVNVKTFIFLSGASEPQVMPSGVSTLTWRLHFDTLDDYWAMLAKLTTTATLTVPANVQTHRGTERPIHGEDYVDLPGTMLLGLSADAPDPDGQIEAVATFQRHIDPATGLLVSS
jgi:hypothetical protein